MTPSSPGSRATKPRSDIPSPHNDRRGASSPSGVEDHWRILSLRHARWTASVLPWIELSLAGAMIASLVWGELHRATLAFAAAMFVAFALGQLALLVHAPGASCGCTGKDSRVGWASVHAGHRARRGCIRCPRRCVARCPPAVR